MALAVPGLAADELGATMAAQARTRVPECCVGALDPRCMLLHGAAAKQRLRWMAMQPQVARCGDEDVGGRVAGMVPCCVGGKR